MSDTLIYDILKNVEESISLIQERFKEIKTEDDFVNTTQGITILDAVSMRLQFVGESLKKIGNIDKSLFKKYPEIQWQHIIKLRNFISHHYEMLDYQIIYDICKNHIPQLKITIEKMLLDLTMTNENDNDFDND